MIRLAPEQMASLPPGVLGPTTADGFAKLHQCFSEPVQEPASEKDFQADVVSFAERCGWWTFHLTIPRKSKAGWPDLVLLRERIIVAELKVPPNVATAAQLDCLDRFRAAGVPAFLWTPADWPLIVEVLKELR